MQLTATVSRKPAAVAVFLCSFSLVWRKGHKNDILGVGSLNRQVSVTFNTFDHFQNQRLKEFTVNVKKRYYCY